MHTIHFPSRLYDTQDPVESMYHISQNLKKCRSHMKKKYQWLTISFSAISCSKEVFNIEDLNDKLKKKGVNT